MGIINDVFQNKLSLSKIEEILNNLLKQGKPQNKQVLQEIGLLNEYTYIISNQANNEIIYYSKENKIIKNFNFSTKIRSNFLEWTRYLFDINDEDLNSIQQFDNKIENFKNKSLTKEFFQNNIKKYIFNNKSFNKLLYYGIPNNFRLFIWDIVLSEKYNNHKCYNYEQELKEYLLIIKKSGNNPQIEKDIHRTFLKDSEQITKNINILKNILNCINQYNPGGYCQGMNYIIGYLLKVTNFDEVKTFYIFKSILKDIKGYFEVGFPLLKNNNNIFNNYFKELYPKLFKHFQKHDIVNEFWVGKWLQTLFTLSLPYEELNIIWDVLLIKGFDFIIYICLAIVDFIEKDALELKESFDITSFLGKVLDYQGTTLYQVNKNYFENIDDYIIPLNEVLQKAYEIEKKINTNNNNKLYYNRKSDGHLLNLKFNTLKNENPIKLNNINTNDELSKKSTNLSIQTSNNINNNNNVNVLNSPINKLGNNNINNNNKVNLQGKKTLFYSTKDLGVYNFNNDLTELKKRGSLQQINNINIQQQRYLYLNNNSNNNISNIRNSNYYLYYP